MQPAWQVQRTHATNSTMRANYPEWLAPIQKPKECAMVFKNIKTYKWCSNGNWDPRAAKPNFPIIEGRIVPTALGSPYIENTEAKGSVQNVSEPGGVWGGVNTI